MLSSTTGDRYMGAIQRFSNDVAGTPKNYTWECWFRPQDLARDFIIMGLFKGNDPLYIGCQPNGKGGSKPYLQYKTDTHVLDEITLVKAGEWVHIALVHEDQGAGTGMFKMVIFDQEFELAQTNNNHSMPVNEYLYFGGIETGAGFVRRQVKPMSGDIDDVRIWQQVRNPQQIKDWMDKPTAELADQVNASPNLLAFVDFDQLAGGVFADLAGGNDGIRVNGASQAELEGNRPNEIDTDTIQVGAGKRALHFTGADDCFVSIPPSNAFVFSNFNELTVEGWINPDSDLAAGTYTIIHKEQAFWLGVKVTQGRRRAPSAKLVYSLNDKSQSDITTRIYEGATLRLGEWNYVAISGVLDPDAVIAAGFEKTVSFGSKVNNTSFTDDPDDVFGTPGHDQDNVFDPDGHELTIGKSLNTTPGFLPFRGLISEIRIWKKNLGFEFDRAGNYYVPDYVLDIADYRWSELPLDSAAVITTNPPTADEVKATLSCKHPDLIAYYKFDHGKPDEANPGINWLRDHAHPKGYLGRPNHGILSAGFDLNGTDNWVTADLQDSAMPDQVFTTVAAQSNADAVPEPGRLLQDPRLYDIKTSPLQPEQRTGVIYGAADWTDINGLYVLTKVAPGDVLVITMHCHKLRNTSDNAGVALGVEIDGAVENRVGIYYERGYYAVDVASESGSLGLQHTYVVPTTATSGLLAIRGVYQAYKAGEAVIQQGSKSTLHVMAYSPRSQV
jgi:hypothetical protein